MSNLSEVWGQVTSLLKSGISIIPVRDKDEKTKTGDVFVAKSPYYKWKEFQNRRITADELWGLMEEKDTTAIAMVCGKVSGNMEVIDIDVKYKPGIDAVLFTDIRTFYPDIYSRLRIHKTPSGGYHIPYFIEGQDAPGNLKLAGRLSSDDEIELQKSRGVKRPNKEVNFLETRGEGGFVLCPPSMGYSIHKDNPIPTITWGERCSLIKLCESYNEIIKVAPKPKSTKSQESYYSESPWDDFDMNVDPTQLIESFGWKYSHQNSRFIWYTRPDKDRGVSASWNKQKYIFWIFTSSTELQGEKGYFASTLLGQLKFNGDFKETYAYLVKEGYGKVKPKIEQQIIKKSVINNKPIPKNFSDDAKKLFDDLKISYKEDHPFGVFWSVDYETDKYVISREDLYNVAFSLGFRSYRNEVVKINGSIVSMQTEQDFFNQMKEYIHEEEEEEYIKICNAYESFIQKSGSFTITRLRLFDDTQIIRDTADKAFKFFRNAYIEINSTQVITHNYENVQGLIWQHKLLDRDWLETAPKECIYKDFLINAVGENGVISESVIKTIGYLSHDFKAENTGYIVVLVEMVPDPRDGGGSGKNIFGNILKATTTVCTVPGSMVQFNEKFLQPWNFQSVYFLADIPKKIDWSFLKEMATGSGILKKLYKNEQSIESHEMPKLLINTNFSFEDADGGLRRRIIPIEFTNFYTISGGVDVTHGKMFPNDFDENDWSGFDHFIAEAIQKLLQAGGKLKPGELTKAGWEKKFKSQYGESTFEFIEDNIAFWVSKGYATTKDFTEKYISFCLDNDINIKFKAGQKLMNMALKDYCDHYNHYFDPRYQKTIDGTSTKVKLFKDPKQEDYLPEWD